MHFVVYDRARFARAQYLGHANIYIVFYVVVYICLHSCFRLFIQKKLSMLGTFPNNPMFDRTGQIYRRIPTVRFERHFYYSISQQPKTNTQNPPLKSPRWDKILSCHLFSYLLVFLNRVQTHLLSTQPHLILQIELHP